VRFFDRRYDLDYELLHTVLATSADRRGTVRWEEVLAEAIDPSQLAHAPDPQARYAPLEAPLSDAKALAAMQKDFAEWAYRESKVAIRANETLKIYVGPQVSQADFREQCSQAARQGRDAEVEKVSEGFDKKIAAIEEKMGREERELKQDEAELSQRKMDEIGTAAETIFSLFGKRRRSVSRSLTKRRMTSQAGADVQESKEAIAEYKRQIAELEGEKEKAVQEVNDRWTEIVNQVSEIPVAAAKKDVLVDLFGVAWLPCYQVQAESELIELPGFGGRGNPNNL
jgi:hypothetical protein